MKKKTPGDIILHLCTTNDYHMMYGSWDMERNRIFRHFGSVFALNPHFSLWAIFLPFYPFNTTEKKFKKWKKRLAIS